MIDKKLYKYAEKLLYEYIYNLIKIERLEFERKELYIKGDVKIQTYKVFHNNYIRDPVFEYYAHLENLERRIFKLKNKTEPVKSLLKILSNPNAIDINFYDGLLKTLQYVYFCTYSIKNSAKLLGISERTVIRRKHSIVGILSPEIRNHDII